MNKEIQEWHKEHGAHIISNAGPSPNSAALPKEVEEAISRLQNMADAIAGGAYLKFGNDDQRKLRDLLQTLLTFATESQAKLAQQQEEIQRLQKNCEFWVREHGIENEKRGVCEHELDLARGNLAESVEKIERHRDRLQSELTEAQREAGELRTWAEEAREYLKHRLRQGLLPQSKEWTADLLAKSPSTSLATLKLQWQKEILFAEADNFHRLGLAANSGMSEGDSIYAAAIFRCEEELRGRASPPVPDKQGA